MAYLNALMGVGGTAYQQKLYEKAQQYIQKALMYHQEMQLNDMALLAQKHLYLGKIAEQVGNPSLAAEHMLTAIKMGEMESFKQHIGWGIFYKDLADYYQQYERYKEALTYNTFALKSLLPSWKNADKGKLPSLEEFNHAISLGLAAQVLMQRAAIAHHNSNHTDQLKNTLEHYRLLDVFVTRLRRLYTGERARLLWSDRALDFYEKAIQTCLSLAQKTGNIQYKKEAFELSERSKSLLLLEAFKKIKAKKIADVPEEAIAKEEALEQQVDELQSEVDVLKKKRRKTEEYKNQLRKKEKALLEANQAYEDFLVQLRKQYPHYYKLKYDLTVVKVDEIQSRLNRDQLMIEYFIGEEELIIFRIGQSSYEVFEIPLQYNLSAAIEQFRQGIYGYYLEATERSEQVRSRYVHQYQKTGRQLYKTLLEPVLDDCHQKRLMIILAGNLGFLPFEALLTEDVEGEHFKSYPYLVRDYAVGYCYSATLLHEMQIKEHIPSNIFLGFAPEFDETVKLEGRYNFQPLQYSEQEVKDIHELIGTGEIFTGENATKENFQENCEGYCILHIATHGFMNSDDSRNSFLAFSEVPDSNDNELLYVRDLYNMHLTASLVVLSACETGLGELYESEGIASLARGFAYAGAKSIITSLWAVNDYATAEIMKKLYTHVQAGNNKDEALFLAKNEFIENSGDKAAHPFLWSAFVMIGDESPRPGTGGQAAGSTTFGLIGGAIGLALLLMGIVFWKRKQSNAPS